MQPDRKLLDEMGRLATEAGERIMRVYEGEISVELKADSSPLTEADRLSHEFLVEHLAALLPGVPVISEESHGPGSVRLEQGARHWLVDPLDGTKEFVKRTGEFTVNIALMEGGAPVMGVVYAPALHLTYLAAKGLGAWRQESGKPLQSIRTRPAPADSLAVVCSKDHAGPIVKEMLARIPNPQYRAAGSSLKFCFVAEGKADLYPRDIPTMEWDTAAAQCVVEAAGGVVLTFDGQPLRYGKPDLKNPSIMTVGDTKLNWKSFMPPPS